MIIGPKYKICRRLGSGVFDKCQSQKFMLSEAKHAKNAKFKRRKQVSEYGSQLLEKQKIRFSYGVTEKQFANYVEEATSAKGVAATDKLYELLERRLDNVVYRLGLASSRPMARQMVSHGHFKVNGKKTDVPSFRINDADVITVRDGSKSSVMFENSDKQAERANVPAWISFDGKNLEATIKGTPKNEGGFLDFNKVIEFYSR